MTLLPYKTTHPRLADDVFVAKGATVIGDVTMASGSSIWFNCTVRGDMQPIRIGRDSNIQDNTVIHIASQGLGTVIGDRVTVGHSAIIHACQLQDESFVGMGAIILDGCVVESGAFIAAGALLPPHTRAEAGMLWAGNPARALRALNDTEKKLIKETPRIYKSLARDYRS
ncbi:MAG: gamma carbonic anhydrase family protein [Alphaproteobacteria bacterium GM202ARS2]|nr:gamma carbonic anhydrase family protein [Alphaproteobacteria bacterium GM202ARS2]